MRSIAALLVTFAVVANAEIPKPDDAPQPLSPAESKKHFKLRDGFRIDLVASEPLIRDPSCIAWGKKGQLFVTEIHGYNLEGHLDVTELNKTGELASAIERLHVGPEMKAEARKGQSGSLKLLRDIDGDGKMDESITWADDIPAAYGVVAARDGVIITAAPDIIYFGDTDGDDRPDVREVLFTGFALGEMERGINNPVFGPDGWIYAGQGWGGGVITGPHLEGAVKMGRHDFRFKADGTAIEPASGSNHTFGMAFDDVGNRFLITTSTPARYAAPLPYHYLKRNPHVSTPDLTVTASNYHNTFPSSQPHPWRRKRGADPRWVKFYGAGEAKPNGNFTSACGQQVYRGTLFPPEFHGNYFCCDPQQSMVHRALISRDGPGVKVRRPDDTSDSEFLTSTDGWFRPNNLRVGPDGALYIVDMYREIIEDYSAIPRYLQQQYGLLNGDDRGRIWRLAPEASAPARIHHNEVVYRDSEANLAIASCYGEGADLKNLMLQLHYGVRLHALRAADAKFGSDKDLLETALGLAETARDPSVLLQLALSLGESDDPRIAATLAKLASEHGGIRWMDSAVLSSLKGKAGEFLTVALKEHPEMGSSILERAAVTAARDGQVAALLAAADHPDEALRLRLLGLAAEHGGEADKEKLRVAANIALSANGRSEREQLAALSLAPFASPWNVAQAVSRVCQPTATPEFQSQAVAVLMRGGDEEIARLLITELPNATPRLAAGIVEALLANAGTTKQLLNSEVKVRFSALQRHRIRNHEDEGVRAGAKFLEVLDELESIPLVGHGGHFAALGNEANPGRGDALFTVHCSTCHQLGGKGVAVGPPLDGETGRPAESLLHHVLDPSAEITAGYATYLVKTKAGASHTGVLASESATSLTLIQAGGAKIEVLRSDLASLERLDLSLMPATFAELMKPRELADLIGFLKQNPGARPGLVLFDDDPAFPSVLTEGRGTGVLDWTDAASGRACLTVDTQRYARRLPGWNFAIREHPQGGEFRYLRIAMRTRTAKGIMLELAADGQFPPEDKPIRTYYAGENSTGWVSNELAREVPREWRSFTIDLWQGNGDFTLTGIAFTPMGAKASYDRIELLRERP